MPYYWLNSDKPVKYKNLLYLQCVMLMNNKTVIWVTWQSFQRASDRSLYRYVRGSFEAVSQRNDRWWEGLHILVQSTATERVPNKTTYQLYFYQWCLSVGACLKMSQSHRLSRLSRLSHFPSRCCVTKNVSLCFVCYYLRCYRLCHPSL